MADDTFVQSVKIEGLAELAAALSKIGEVGQRAFEQIGKGADSAAKPLSEAEKAAEAFAKKLKDAEAAAYRFGSSVRDIGTALGGVVDAVENTIKRTGVLAAAVGAAATAFVLFEKNVLAGIDALQESADAANLSTDAFQRYQFAAVSGGATAQQFSSGVNNAAKLFRSALQEQDTAILKFAESVKKFPTEIGVIRNPFFGRDIAREFEIIREAAQRIAQERNLPFFRVEQELRSLANAGAAGRAELEKLGVSLPPIRDGLEGMRAAADKGGNAFTKLGVPLRDARGNARQFEDVLKDFVKRLAKVEDPMEKAGLSAEVFGQRVGPALAAALAKTGGSFEEAIKAGEQFGLFLDKNAIAKGAEAQSRIDLLGLAFTNLQRRIALAFADPFTAGTSGLTQFIATNTKAFEELATRIATRVKPIVEDLLAILSGNRGAVRNEWVLQTVRFFEALATVIKDKVVFAFNLLLNISDKLSKAINAVFGTNLNKEMVAASIALFALTGGFRLLFSIINAGIAVITTLGNAARVISVALGSGGAAGAASSLGAALRALTIPGAIAAALLLIIKYTDELKAAVTAVAAKLDEMFGTTIFTTIGNFIKLILEGVGALKTLITTSEEVKQFLLAMIPAPVMFALEQITKLLGHLQNQAKLAGDGAAILGEALRRVRTGDVRSWDEFKRTLGELEQQFRTTGTVATTAGDEIASANKKVVNSTAEIANKAKPLTKVAEGVYKSLGQSAEKAATTIERTQSDTTAATTDSATKQKSSIEDLQQTFAKGAEPVYAFGRAIRDGLGAIITNEQKNVRSLIADLERLGQLMTQPLVQTPTEPTTPAGDTEFGGRARRPAGTDVDTSASTAAMNALATATDLARSAIERLLNLIDDVNASLVTLANRMTDVADPTRALTVEIQNVGGALHEGRGKISAFADALAALDLSGKFDAVARAVGDAVDTIASKFQDLISAVEQASTSMASSVSSALDQVISKLDTAIQKANELAAAVASSGGGGGGGGAVEAATGGLITGARGVDKIPAWLTHKEFVVNADATMKNLPLLRAINSGMKLPKFNMGGLVSGALSSLTPPSPRLAFANGGQADSGALTRIDLALGGGTVVQVQARRSAVNEINDFALKRKAASAGRRPRGGV